MMKKRLACGLAVGLAAAVLVTGCSSKDKQLAGPSGSMGLLGNRELVPAPFGQPSDLKMLPANDGGALGKADAVALKPDLKTATLDGGIPAEPDLDIVDARLQSVVPPPPTSTAKPANGAFVPAPAEAVSPKEEPILDLGKQQPAATQDKAAAKQIYTVRRGDTLTSIARMYGVTWQAIVMENKLSNGSIIKVGQKLTMPAEAKAVKVPAAVVPAKPVKQVSVPRTGRSRSSVKPLPQDGRYTVKSGDSLWRIADRYGLKIKDIRRWNNLRSDMLKIDQVLMLRGDAVPQDSKQVSPGKKQAKSSVRRSSKAKGYTGLSGDKHIVTRGESVWSIARDYKIRQDDLMKWNGLKSTRLQINQVLLVKAPGGDRAATEAPAAVQAVPEQNASPAVSQAPAEVVDFHKENAAVPVATQPQETVSPVPTAFAAPAGASQPVRYQVVPGETLERILQEKGIQIDEFRRLNPSVDTEKPLQAGMELMLPF